MNSKIILFFIITGILIIIFLSYTAIFSSNLQSVEEKYGIQVIVEKQPNIPRLKNMSSQNLLANEILQECGFEEHCTVESLQNIARTKTKTQVITTVNELMTVYDNQKSGCHPLGHHIGEFLLGFSNGNASLAFSYSDRKCDGSLFHGIIENYLKKSVILDGISPNQIDVANSCNEFIDFELRIQIECAHGMGHGLFRVFDSELNPSLVKCDEYNSKSFRQVCYRGIFMENIVTVDEKNQNFDKDNIFYPCDSLEEKYAQVCYQYQVSYIDIKSQKPIHQECDKIDTEDLIPFCYIGIGEQRVSIFMDDWTPLVIRCLEGNSQFQNYCFIGAVVGISDIWGNDEGFEFCAIVPDNVKSDCYEYLGKFIHEYSTTLDEINEECLKAEAPDYYQICKEADPEDFHILIS